MQYLFNGIAYNLALDQYCNLILSSKNNPVQEALLLKTIHQQILNLWYILCNTANKRSVGKIPGACKIAG